MELSELRYFFHVATTRSFSKGARLSHISPPAISKAIKKLEEELGTTLLQRSTRSVSVTPTGEILLEHCRQVLGQLDALVRDIDGVSDRIRGPLRVGAMEVFGAHSLPVCMARIIAAFPDVEPSAFVLGPNRIVEGLLQGTLDVGFVVGNIPDARIDNQVLVRCPGSLVCGRQHPLYESGTITAEDVGRFPSVVQQFHGRPDLGPADQFPDERLPRNIGVRVGTLNMGIKLVEEGPLLGFFPDVAIRCQLNHGELRRLQGLDVQEHFELSAITAGEPRPSVRRLVESMTQALEELLVAECAV